MSIDWLLPERELPAQYRAALRRTLSDLPVRDTGRLATLRRRASRRGGVVFAAAAAVVASGGALAYTQLTSSGPVTNEQSARCYTAAVYAPGDEGQPFPGTTVGEPTGPSDDGYIDDALRTCSDLWRTGVLHLGVNEPITSPEPGLHRVPDLVACVLPDGRAAIFPGEPGTCAGLGLQAAEASPPR